MTLQERQQAFVKELEALSKTYGFTVGAQITHEQVAPTVWERAEALMRLVGVAPQAILIPTEGWTASDSQETA